MRKIAITVAAALVLCGTLNSCIGSFALSNKLLSWNRGIDNKFVNELVFFAFWIVPVYEVSFLSDILVLNSIEFWSGTSPVAESKQIIEGNDGKYLVERDSEGYTITSLNDQSVVRLNFHEDEQTWTVTGVSGEEFPLITFVDDSHLKVTDGHGGMILVERSAEGLYAYQQAISTAALDLAQR